jgi:hypothetical protein
MPVCSIPLAELRESKPQSDAQARAWCARLEAGEILFFPQTPVPIPAADLEFLLSARQTGSALHKNIAYKPARDQLSGFDAKATDAAEVGELHSVMRRYSASIAGFLKDFLAPYRQRWILDYASFRPLEEQGRDLALRKRNDMLHTDAFPTRPTRGRRILRFFHNIHPTRTRDWIVSEPFPRVVGAFAPGILAIPHADGAFAGVGKRAAQAIGLGGVIPQLKRTPYDQFMMELHNAMKENAEFQKNCVKESVNFPPGSSWMVYTETVPHAVLAGQYALEQTFLIDPAAMVTPESAPVAILEKMAAARLV